MMREGAMQLGLIAHVQSGLKDTRQLAATKRIFGKMRTTCRVRLAFRL